MTALALPLALAATLGAGSTASAQEPAVEPGQAENAALETAVEQERLLQGPYPFLLDNDLALDGGYAWANGWSGVRISASYGYSLAGSLWLGLQIDSVGAGDHTAPPDCTTCGEVRTFFDVLAGFRYKLRTPIPLVPYATALMGPVFLLHRQARGAMGIAVRGGVGARYYLYEWFGVGLEIGALLGAAAVDEAAGLDSQLRMLDINIGAQVSF